MCRQLPTGGFRWVKSNLDSWDKQKINDLARYEQKGYLLEVDVDDDLHNDLPFMPEITAPAGNTVKKLIPNLNNKRRYIIHIRVLD